LTRNTKIKVFSAWLLHYCAFIYRVWISQLRNRKWIFLCGDPLPNARCHSLLFLKKMHVICFFVLLVTLFLSVLIYWSVLWIILSFPNINQTRAFFTTFREEVNLKIRGGPKISHQILLTSKQFTQETNLAFTFGRIWRWIIFLF
jgi:hypothetical protein